MSCIALRICVRDGIGYISYKTEDPFHSAEMLQSDIWHDGIRFMVFDNETGAGQMFTLTRKEAGEFRTFIATINEYMKKHLMLSTRDDVHTSQVQTVSKQSFRRAFALK